MKGFRTVKAFLRNEELNRLRTANTALYDENADLRKEAAAEREVRQIVARVADQQDTTIATLREALGPILEQLDRMEWVWQRADGKPDDPQWLKTQKSFYLRIGEARKMKALAATEGK